MIHVYKCSMCAPLVTRHTSRRKSNSCHTLSSMSGVIVSTFAVIVLQISYARERGLGLRMRTKREHLLFLSMWETYFCVRFQNRNGRSKPLQSFWYTLHNNTRAVLKVFSHFEYLDNRERGLDITWQPFRGDLTVGLVSWQWDAADWTCVLCDSRIHKSHFQQRF
jgi:hypothetical protein